MNPKKKIIIISIIFGIISSALVIFGVYPLVNGIKKNSEELIGVKKELILFKEEIGKFSELREVYAKLEPDLEKTDKLFIDPEVPIDLIRFWENMAADSGLLINISPIDTKTEEGAKWKSMGFEVTLAGSFPNFLKFLEKTESAPYLIEIQNLTIRKLTGAEIGSQKYEGFSQDDISATLVTKVFTK